MKYVLGIDLGTSGTKTVLFDQSGKVICSATVEYPLYQPQNGWAEQNPKDWYNAAVSTIRTVLGKSGVGAEDFNVPASSVCVCAPADCADSSVPIAPPDAIQFSAAVTASFRTIGSACSAS